MIAPVTPPTNPPIVTAAPERTPIRARNVVASVMLVIASAEEYLEDMLRALRA